jgi:hypothetical protein
MIKCKQGQIEIEGNLEETLTELIHVIHGIRETLKDGEEKDYFDMIIRSVLNNTNETKKFFDATVTSMEVERQEKNEGETK